MSDWLLLCVGIRFKKQGLKCGEIRQVSTRENKEDSVLMITCMS